ncbi:MAG: XdhC family protein [Microcystis sp. M53600_WE12]|jgi:xanthine dehydrogenase accessory factor|nr:XdhC family protein [Microcystis sp. M53600_WE12]
MKNVLTDFEQWLSQGNAVALATVVNTQGSTPREMGTVMAVNELGLVSGSLSGGCVEAAVIEESLSVISDGQPRLLTYGVADELGLEVGLTCGGTIQIFVERWELTPIWPFLRQMVSSEQPFVLCTLVEGHPLGAKLLIGDGEQTFGSLENELLSEQVALEAKLLLEQGKSALRCYSLNGHNKTEVKIFLHCFACPPHLMIFGAVDFARSLCQLAKLLGYRVTICDARPALATRQRFPEADRIVVDSPSQYLQNTPVDSNTAMAVLTHEPKFDVPLLVQAVRTPAVYIGAMGSRQTTASRLEKLKEAGLNNAEIARICAPIGLDIGAVTPAETAVSIMAEVIATKSGRAGGRLSSTQQPIHPKRVEQPEEAVLVCQ